MDGRIYGRIQSEIRKGCQEKSVFEKRIKCVKRSERKEGKSISAKAV